MVIISFGLFFVFVLFVFLSLLFFCLVSFLSYFIIL